MENIQQNVVDQQDTISEKSYEHINQELDNAMNNKGSDLINFLIGDKSEINPDTGQEIPTGTGMYLDQLRATILGSRTDENE
jgi:hypothetical protein